MSRANPFGQRNDGGWCECAECGRRFGGLTGFDMHRITTTGQDGYEPEYDWRCTTDEELSAAGFGQDARGTWRDYSKGSYIPEGGTRTAAEVASQGTGP